VDNVGVKLLIVTTTRSPPSARAAEWTSSQDRRSAWWLSVARMIDVSGWIRRTRRRRDVVVGV
jgi:hypothetical protein